MFGHNCLSEQPICHSMDYAQVNNTVQFVWDVRAVVNQTRQLVWNTHINVNQSRGLVWNVYTPVSNDTDLRWYTFSDNDENIGITLYSTRVAEIELIRG